LLLSTINWCTEENGALGDLIKRIFASACEVPPEEFIVPPNMISGSTSHRFRDLATTHGGFSTNLYTPYTHIMFTTNTLKDFAKSAKNTNLHFQCSMLAGQFVFCDQLVRLRRPMYYGHYHMRCNCVTNLNEEFLVGSEELRKIEVPSCTENPLLYIPRRVLRQSQINDFFKIYERTTDNEEYLRDFLFSANLCQMLMKIEQGDESIQTLVRIMTNDIYYNRCDPNKVLKYVLYFLGSKILVERHILVDDHIDQDEFKGNLIRSIRKLKDAMLIPIAYMFVCPDTRRFLKELDPEFVPLTSNPPTTQELCAMLKENLEQKVLSNKHLIVPDDKLVITHSLINVYDPLDWIIYHHYVVNNGPGFIRLCRLFKLLKAYSRNENSKPFTCATLELLDNIGIASSQDSVKLIGEFFECWGGLLKGNMDVIFKVKSKKVSLKMRKPSAFHTDIPSEFTLFSQVPSLKYLLSPFMLDIELLEDNVEFSLEVDMELESLSIDEWTRPQTLKLASLGDILTSLVNSSSVLVTGDQSGSDCSLLIKLNKRLKLICHTDFNPEEIYQCTFADLLPPMIDYLNIKKNLVDFPLILEMNTDLKLPHLIRLQYGQLTEFDGLIFHFKLSYMVNYVNAVKILISLESIIQTGHLEWVIVRFFHRNNKFTSLLISLVSTHFRSTHLGYSHFSKINGGEFFLIGTKRRANVPYLLNLEKNILYYSVHCNSVQIESVVDHINEQCNVVGKRRYRNIDHNVVSQYRSFFMDDVKSNHISSFLFSIGITPASLNASYERVSSSILAAIQEVYNVDPHMLNRSTKFELTSYTLLKMSKLCLLYNVISSDRWLAISQCCNITITKPKRKKWSDAWLKISGCNRKEDFLFHDESCVELSVTRILGRSVRKVFRLCYLAKNFHFDL